MTMLPPVLVTNQMKPLCFRVCYGCEKILPVRRVCKMKDEDSCTVVSLCDACNVCRLCGDELDGSFFEIGDGNGGKVRVCNECREDDEDSDDDESE